MDLPAGSPGHGSAKCRGTNRSGKPCGNGAGKGTDHVGTGNCASHCGNTPSGRAAAVTERAVLELARLDVQPVGDPLRQLAILAGQMLAWRDAMAGKVSALTSLRYEAAGENGTGEQLRAEVALWERALDRCERVLTAMAKLNIDERLARVSEAQVAMIEKALTAAMASEGLDLEAQARARNVLGRHLRAV